MLVKQNGSWRLVGSAFTKNNGIWSTTSLSQISGLTATHICNYAGTYEGTNFVLSIVGPTTMIGETCHYSLTKNGVAVPPAGASWSIVSGGTYATIDSNGDLTILSGASASTVTIAASYLSKTKELVVTLTYQPNATATTTTHTETITSGDTTIEVTTTTTEIIDESGNTTTTSSVVEIITDESGDTTYRETNEVTNPDGSSNSTAITYNEDGDPTDKVNEITDVVGNVDTQQIEYDQEGNEVVTGYEIDTTGSGGEGKEIEGDGVNTEFIPFSDNNCGFVCHIIFDTEMSAQPRPPIVEDTEDTGSNWLYNILSAKSPFKGDSAWPGFDIRWAIDKKTGTSGSIQFRYSSAGASSTAARSMYGKNESGSDTGITYDLIITYDPQLVLPTSRTTFSVTSPNGCISSIGTNVTFDSNNVDFTIGYAMSQAGTPYRFSNVTIRKFSIVKVCSASLITPDEPVVSCNGVQVTIECETEGADIFYRLNREARPAGRGYGPGSPI